MSPPSRSPARLLLTAVLSVVLLALIGVTRAHHIEFDQRVAPITYSGHADEVVDASRFTLEVDNVEFGHDIAGGDFEHLTGTEANPDYVWMVVTVTIEATAEPLQPHDPARLESGGDTYAGTPGRALASGGSAGTATLEAGIPVTEAIAFELPADELDDPSLRVTTVSSGAGSDERLSAEAVVDLGLDEDELRSRVDDADEIVEIAGSGTAGEQRAPSEPVAQDGVRDD